MLEKNAEKKKRKERRKTWVGLFPRKTPTKKERERRIEKKHGYKPLD